VLIFKIFENGGVDDNLKQTAQFHKKKKIKIEKEPGCPKQT